MWSEKRELFDVYGHTGEQWEPFQKNIRYHAFLLQRIEYVNLEEQNTYYMPSSTKKTNKKKVQREELIEFIVLEPSTNPFLIRKMEDARKSFETAGFPRELFERNRSRKK
jgi:CDP-diacylglycerol pyrophosphatase